MKFIAYVRSIMSKIFRRSEIEQEMEEELRSHIQHRADDLEQSGLSRSEAERRARIEFGGRGRFKEECQEALGGIFVETLIQDVRFSVRALRKSSGFTITAVLTLALAIGANAVVFGVMDALILRPLNVPQPRACGEQCTGKILHSNRIRIILICEIETTALNRSPLLSSSL